MSGSGWFDPYGDGANWVNGIAPSPTGSDVDIAPSSKVGLFGGQHADMMANVARSRLAERLFGGPADLSGNGTGLRPSVTIAPYLPRIGDPDGSLGLPPAADAPSPIDASLIARQEGGQQNHLYPLQPVSKFPNAGLTVATGVDLGAHTADDLRRWGVSDETITALKPYLGLKGQAAIDALPDRHNLKSIGQADQDAMDRGVLNDTIGRVRQAYDATNPTTDFSNLTPGQQTAIVDLAYQFGTNLAKSAPKFWGAATSGDWNGAVNQLNHFYGPTVTPSQHDIDRRAAEARYIQGRGPSPGN